MLENAGKRIRLSASVAAAATGAAATLLVALPVSAQTGPGLLLEPFPKEQLTDTRGGFLAVNGGHVKGTDESVQLSFVESTGRVRVIPGNLISPRVGWDLEYVLVNADGGALDDALPSELTDHSVGVAFPVAKVGEWIFGVSLGVGYAGGTPWADGSGWYGKATAVGFRQLREREALVFAIDWDGNRSFLPDVPLPGFAYTRGVGDTLTFIVGIPLSSVTWKPLPKLSLEAGYFPVESFDAAIGYGFAPHWSVFGNLEYRSTAFWLDEIGGNDRLIFEQRRAEVGVRYAPLETQKAVAFTAAVGYAWGQEFSIGFDSRDTDVIADLSDEPYLRVGLELKF
ncbi:MAG TPA: hypothetical protein VFB66_31075 [Tepidisphaeraceae bacterium]|nr:hypothetical protein [Tepidisphaeraceae bacterium]